MEAKMKKPYTTCPPRKKIDNHVDEATMKEFAKDFRVIPMFEKLLYEHVYKRHYSLTNNENLKCAWLIYKRNIDTKKFAPFQFPNDRSLHFYNGMIRFLPSESVHTRESYRMSLKPGPGFDNRGQKPIPQEFFFKRFSSSIKGRERKTAQKSEPAEEKEQ